MKEQPLGTTSNSRTDAQRDRMEGTVEKGVCPLCNQDNFNKVIKEGIVWQAWHNPFPYPNQTHHIIIATRDHEVNVGDLSPAAWSELGLFLEWAIQEFDLPGGGIVLRFGDPAFNAGTLRHLHVHIQVPDGKGPSFAVFGKFDMSLPPEELQKQRNALIAAFTPRQ